MPVWVNSKKTPAVSSHTRLWSWLVSKRFCHHCSHSPQGKCSLAFHTEKMRPHGPEPTTWMWATTWGGNICQHRASCIDSRCSAHFPSNIKLCTAVWYCPKAISNYFWLQPRRTCKIQSPRTAPIQWENFSFLLKTSIFHIWYSQIQS